MQLQCNLFLLYLGQTTEFYNGRSAQVLLRPYNVSFRANLIVFYHTFLHVNNLFLTPFKYKENSAIFILNRHTESNQIDVVETSVADYISHTIGGPIVNSEIHNSISNNVLPKGNLFDKDVANLFVVMDGVDSGNYCIINKNFIFDFVLIFN